MWRRVPPALVEKMAKLFTRCLEDGVFPRRWKRARLVLIPKAGSISDARDGIPKARPICLLNKIGKIFERILVQRFKVFMATQALVYRSGNMGSWRVALL